MIADCKKSKAYIPLQRKVPGVGVGVGQCPQRQNFVLEIPTCWYILALPNAKNCSNLLKSDANPRRQSVEYSWRWAFWHWGWRWACTFHVFLLISFAFCSQRKPSFQWNMGFIVCQGIQNKYCPSIYYIQVIIQLPKGCECIRFLSPVHKKIPFSYSKREGSNPRNSGL